MSSVQPLSAPMAERMTAMEIAAAPQSPHITRAASENGATDGRAARAALTPSPLLCRTRRASAAIVMPRTVESGMVRFGSITSPAGIVADSNPKKANMVSGASAALAASSDLPLGLNSLKFDVSMKNNPIKRNGGERHQFCVGGDLRK